MIHVVPIMFYNDCKPSGKVYYFKTTGQKINKDFDVIVETERGEEIVRVVEKSYFIEKDKIAFELKEIKRVANHNDRKNKERNFRESKALYIDVRNFVSTKMKDMQVISAEYSLNRDLLLITYVSEDRVDFRDLLKELASKYKTRIELKQVGVRDEAKIIGGIGMCGRVICCNSFISDFASVSINMAKNQSLALIPSKISGLCGRLLCCLRYEDEEYKVLKKGLPKIGSRIDTEQGNGKVVAQNVLLRTVRVLLPDKTTVDIKINGSN